MRARTTSTGWAALRRGFLAVLLLGLAVATSARADDDRDLDALRAQIDNAQKALAGKPPDAELLRLRGAGMAARDQADALVERLTPQFASVQERLTELGTPAPGTREPPDVAQLRSQLEKTRASLDGQIKLARLMSVEGLQVANQAWAQRRSQFQAQLGERTASILAPPFWSELLENASDDAGRLAALGKELSGGMRAAPLQAWAVVLVSLAVIAVVRLGGSRWLLRLVAAKVPSGRLRRSALASGRVALSVACAGLAVWVVHLGLVWAAPLSSGTERLLDTFTGVFCFGAYVAALGNALLSARRPSWRLPPVPDPVALRFRWLPATLGSVTVVGWLTEQLGTLATASLATTVALDCIVALALGGTMGLALVQGERLRRIGLMDEAAGAPPRPLWFSILKSVTWVVLGASLVGLLIGYVALGSFVVRQMAWVSTVAMTAYLLCTFVDDLCLTLLAAPAAPGDGSSAASASAPPPKLRNQVAVLLSAALRLLVVLFALVLVLAPFGEGPPELARRAGQIGDGIGVGEFNLRPLAVVQGLLVLVLTLWAVRALKRWMETSYLPTTSLDAGMRTSAVTLLGYAGSVTAVAVAMSALGIGLERIAWVASALSVGIGFGLQAVVQNFVSGLILLAERPVKVGDWVSLGGVEGDIRRINVRATEIQMGDRSTVIVPNSEFITKTVRNVTHANALGLVQIKLPMPLDTHVAQVKELLLAAFQAHTEVLETPAPSVALDGIAEGRLVFNATGFVSSPRLAYNVRSDLLFVVLDRLRSASLAISPPATMLLERLPAAAPPLPEAGAGAAASAP